jgi:hypothetical protein
MTKEPFHDATMTLTDINGNEIAKDLPTQVDTVNMPWNMEVQGTIPTDWFDVYSCFWTTPVPARGNYFIDQDTHEKYQVFAVTASYVNHLEVRVSRYSGATP